MEATRDELLQAIKLADDAGDIAAVEEIAGMLDAMAANEVPAIDPNVMVDSAQRRQEQLTPGKFMKEAAKTGATESIAGLAALAQAGYDKVTGTSDFLPALGQHFVENQNAAQQFLIDAGIFDPAQFSPAEMRQADPTGGYLYTGAKALVDPLALASPLLKAPGAVAKGGSIAGAVAPVATRAIESSMAGIGGELGGQVGEQFAGPEGALVGALAGGSVMPSVTAPVRSAIGEGVAKGVSKGREIVGASKSEAKAASYSSKAANNLLKDIAAEAGGPEDIDRIIKNYEAISGIVGKKDFPLIVAMADNITLRTKFNEIARGAKGPALRAQMKAEMDKLSTAIQEKSDILFGSRDISFVNMEANIDLKKAADEAAKKAASIEQRIYTISDPLKQASKENVGDAVKKLIDAKSDAVRSSLRPEYQKVINEATEAGAKMPAEGTQAIYDFVVQNKMRDIFGRTTEVDNKVMSILAPKKVTETTKPSPLMIGQTAKTTTVSKFNDMSFENVDSLKRLINQLQRENASNSDVMRKLTQFEKVVDNQRELIPGDFNERLRQVDLAFYEQMGIPFDNKAIKQLGAKDYVEKVAPLLLNKPSSAKQFLETVGPDAVPVLKTTILSKLYDSAVNPDGSIKQSALENAIKNNAEFIDLIPGLGDELTDMVARNSDDLIAHKAAIDQVNRAQKDLDAAEILARDPQMEFTFNDVARSLDDPAKLAKFNSNVSKLDKASQNLLNERLQREVVAQALKRPDSLEYLTDPNNTAVLTRIMGTKYVEDLKAFAQLSDMMKKVDLNNVTPFPGQNSLDPAMRKLGVPTAGITSVLRDRIMSGTQKVVVLAAKANVSRIKNAEDIALMEAFLDPDGLSKLAKISREASTKTDIGVNGVVQRMMNVVKGRLPQYSVSATARELSRQNEEQLSEPMMISVTKPIPQ